LAYLDKQSANSPDKPIKIAMKANVSIKNCRGVISKAGKYVSLDFSGFPFTEIPENTLNNYYYIAGIVIPDSAISIGYKVFEYCTSLTMVTFQGMISSSRFDSDVFGDSGFDGYIGDLRDKYLAKGVGTYMRAKGGETWTKQ
jgi:hypothetical protein